MSTAEYESQVAKVAVQKLYQNEKMADVHFVFDSGERVPAHKYLLAAASEVFEAMFYGSIKEKGDVKMNDASAAGFVEFLQFFYCDRIKLTMANIGAVMDFGHKYDVAECVNLCVRFSMEHLSADNVLQAHGLAVLFEQDNLKSECDNLISSSTEDVLRSPSFLECNRSMLNHILTLEEVSCSETDVFKAVMLWVKAASKQEELTKDIIQTHLGDLFYQIRFRSMTVDEFINLLPSFGELFTAVELTEVLQMIKNDEFQPKMFNAKPRAPAMPSVSWDENAVIDCNRFKKHLPNDPYRIRNTETTTFTTNKPLLLGSFSCLPISKFENGTFFSTTIPADVTIVRAPKGVEALDASSESIVLSTWDVELASIYTSIKLPKSIVIDPKFKYKIRMNISEEYATHIMLKTEVQLRDDIVVTFHDDPVVNGKTRGLVYMLKFNRLNSTTRQSSNK